MTISGGEYDVSWSTLEGADGKRLIATAYGHISQATARQLIARLSLLLDTEPPAILPLPLLPDVQVSSNT